MKVKIKDKEMIIIVVLIVLIFLTQIGLRIKKNITVELDQDTSEVSFDVSNEEIKVHIDGEVRAPGVYTLSPEARVEKLIAKAGGMTEKADTNRINLARKLSDGVKIHIPKINEKNNEIQLTLTDLNRFSKKEWTSIKGIGEVMAKRIINYKKENGEFTSVDDLLNVKGIGEKLLEDIKAQMY